MSLFPLTVGLQLMALCGDFEMLLVWYDVAVHCFVPFMCGQIRNC
jgi:hypothetical protein